MQYAVFHVNIVITLKFKRQIYKIVCIQQYFMFAAKLQCNVQHPSVILEWI